MSGRDIRAVGIVRDRVLRLLSAHVSKSSGRIRSGLSMGGACNAATDQGKGRQQLRASYCTICTINGLGIQKQCRGTKVKVVIRVDALKALGAS